MNDKRDIIENTISFCRNNKERCNNVLSVKKGLLDDLIRIFNELCPGNDDDPEMCQNICEELSKIKSICKDRSIQISKSTDRCCELSKDYYIDYIRDYQSALRRITGLNITFADEIIDKDIDRPQCFFKKCNNGSLDQCSDVSLCIKKLDLKELKDITYEDISNIIECLLESGGVDWGEDLEKAKLLVGISDEVKSIEEVEDIEISEQTSPLNKVETKEHIREDTIPNRVNTNFGIQSSVNQRSQPSMGTLRYVVPSNCPQTSINSARTTSQVGKNDKNLAIGIIAGVVAILIIVAIIVIVVVANRQNVQGA